MAAKKLIQLKQISWPQAYHTKEACVTWVVSECWSRSTDISNSVSSLDHICTQIWKHRREFLGSQMTTKEISQPFKLTKNSEAANILSSITETESCTQFCATILSKVFIFLDSVKIKFKKILSGFNCCMFSSFELTLVSVLQKKRTV